VQMQTVPLPFTVAQILPAGGNPEPVGACARGDTKTCAPCALNLKTVETGRDFPVTGHLPP
jgi:hypothetical protein